jgi:hypothetical protein
MVTLPQLHDFFAARRHYYSDYVAFQAAREKLLAEDEAEVRAAFETLLHDPDEEVRCQALTGIASLYGAAATETLLRWIDDPSSTVRWVVCGCLHDRGDERAAAALLDRLQHEQDCQVRGVAASALGEVGSSDVLPHLHAVWQSDHEVDELGHSPSCLAQDAMTSVLRRWVTRQIAGAPAKGFEEIRPSGRVRGVVTAEAIPFDPEGRINRVPRYAHVPMSAFGFGWSSQLGLQTTLTPPFEIEVEYVGPSCTVERIFVYHRIEGSDSCDWAVDTIVDTGAMKRPR